MKGLVKITGKLILALLCIVFIFLLATTIYHHITSHLYFYRFGLAITVFSLQLMRKMPSSILPMVGFLDASDNAGKRVQKNAVT